MNQHYHPWHRFHTNSNSVHSYHNLVQDGLPYFHSQSSNMQVYTPKPTARNRISELFLINQSSAPQHNSNFQVGNMSCDTLFQPQLIVSQAINTQATGAQDFQGRFSYDEMM